MWDLTNIIISIDYSSGTSFFILNITLNIPEITLGGLITTTFIVKVPPYGMYTYSIFSEYKKCYYISNCRYSAVPLVSLIVYNERLNFSPNCSKSSVNRRLSPKSRFKVNSRLYISKLCSKLSPFTTM